MEFWVGIVLLNLQMNLLVNLSRGWIGEAEMETEQGGITGMVESKEMASRFWFYLNASKVRVLDA